MHLHPNGKTERGQSLAEMALAITFLFILLAGLIDTGRLFFSFMALRDAAQEGVNYAIYHPYDASKALDVAAIEARVRQAACNPVVTTDGSGVTTSSCQPNSLPVDLQDEDGVSVAVTASGALCNNNNPTSPNKITVTVTENQFVITAPFFGALILGDPNTSGFPISASITGNIVTPKCQ